jgi:hypothetical protein
LIDGSSGDTYRTNTDGVFSGWKVNGVMFDGDKAIKSLTLPIRSRDTAITKVAFVIDVGELQYSKTMDVNVAARTTEVITCEFEQHIFVAAGEKVSIGFCCNQFCDNVCKHNTVLYKLSYKTEGNMDVSIWANPSYDFSDIPAFSVNTLSFNKFDDELDEVKARLDDFDDEFDEAKGRINRLEDAENVQRLVAPFKLFAESITSESPMSIGVPCTKYDNSIGFDADITSFYDLTIAHGKNNSWGGGYVVIDNTNITIYKFGDAPSVVSTYSHGLTITQHITVNISVDSTKREAIVRLATPSGIFVTPSCMWDASHRTVTVEVSDGVLTNATICYGCNSANNDVWAFGDSFFDYWTPIVYEMGFTKWMVDSYSGRKSNEGYNAFKRCLQVHVPKTVIWCMGMNDFDNIDFSNGTINTDWKYYADLLIADCETNGIELILCTIPNTPIRNHTYKNEYIKSSGLRYIDLDRAVGGSASGWYDGLLSADNVHPSTKAHSILLML